MAAAAEVHTETPQSASDDGFQFNGDIGTLLEELPDTLDSDDVFNMLAEIVASDMKENSIQTELSRSVEFLGDGQRYFTVELCNSLKELSGMSVEASNLLYSAKGAILALESLAARLRAVRQVEVSRLTKRFSGYLPWSSPTEVKRAMETIEVKFLDDLIAAVSSRRVRVKLLADSIAVHRSCLARLSSDLKAYMQ